MTTRKRFAMLDAARTSNARLSPMGDAPPGWVGCGGVASGVVAEGRAWGWSRSNGRLEESLDSRDDELWLLGLNEARRVDNFVLSVAPSFAAELPARLFFKLNSFRSAVAAHGPRR
jgi:hypothetical protein